MQGAYLGPEFSREQMKSLCDANGWVYEAFDDDDAWAIEGASRARSPIKKVVGLFQGRMEVGPRALGHRSILGDPRSPAMQSIMNLKIKLSERASVPVRAERSRGARRAPTSRSIVAHRTCCSAPTCGPSVASQPTAARSDDLLAWVNRARSDVPAITHVDYSARIQTVHRGDQPALPRTDLRVRSADRLRDGDQHQSFNVRGEPIVCSP